MGDDRAKKYTRSIGFSPEVVVINVAALRLEGAGSDETVRSATTPRIDDLVRRLR